MHFCDMSFLLPHRLPHTNERQRSMCPRHDPAAARLRPLYTNAQEYCAHKHSRRHARHRCGPPRWKMEDKERAASHRSTTSAHAAQLRACTSETQNSLMNGQGACSQPPIFDRCTSSSTAESKHLRYAAILGKICQDKELEAEGCLTCRCVS